MSTDTRYNSQEAFSIVITLQTYAHALPQDDAEAADRIAAAFE